MLYYCQVAAFLLAGGNGNELLVVAAKSGNLDMLKAAGDFIEAQNLLQEVCSLSYQLVKLVADLISRRLLRRFTTRSLVTFDATV